MNHDNVNYPKHYTQQPVECIEFTQRLNFCMGNAFKYIWRHGEKNGAEDLKKAEWYLRRQMEEKPNYLELDDDTWAYLGAMLDDCRFEGHQESALRAIIGAASDEEYCTACLEIALQNLEEMRNGQA